jgi:hypothetical protein
MVQFTAEQAIGEGEVVMRRMKRPVIGLLIAGALAFSVGGADARGGGCGPCYFVGITPAPGGSPPDSGYQGGGFQANSPQSGQYRSGHMHQNSHSGYGTLDGGYYRGY